MQKKEDDRPIVASSWGERKAPPWIPAARGRGGGGRETTWQGTWKAAALDDAAELRVWLEHCRVVVNAGPTADGGEHLIAAAIAAGVHYIDAAGSQPYIHHVFEHYGPRRAKLSHCRGTPRPTR